MKPNFALSLSFEGIGLLHRAFPGWNRVGEVALDSPDLSGALEVLRETAQQINGQDLTSKLVVPNEQIRYLTLDLGLVDETERTDAILKALDGATPYPVDHLAYDWSVEDGKTHVAAVARETLAEAEKFARDHGFGPVCFVAIPAADQFSGEPFFGPTEYAATLLGDGAEVQRDMAPIRITGVVRLPDPGDEDAEDTPEPAAPAPESDAAQDIAAETDTEQADPPQDDAAPETAADAEPEADVEPLGVSVLSDTLPGIDDDDTPDPEIETLSEDADAPLLSDRTDTADAPEQDDDSEVTDPAPAFSTIRADRDEDSSFAAPSLSGVRRDDDPMSAPAPVATIEPFDDTAAPAIEATPETYGAYDAPGEADAASQYDADNLPGPDLEGEPREGRLSFFSRRSSQMASDLAGSMRNSLANRSARRGDALTPAEQSADSPHSAADVDSERQRMTVFGARKPESNTQPVGGKPRYLGLVLTAVLLIFLAGVAAWASIFMDDGLARLFGPRDTEVVTLPADAVDEMTAEGEEAMVPEAPDDAVETASLEPDTIPDEAETPLVQPTLPHALTEKEAQALYALTGVWQRAPQEPQLPDQLSLDDLYLSSIDPGVDAQDAVALPETDALATDLALGRVPLPAKRGTRFNLDDRGLVIASADGALSPEGFLVFAGRPPSTPAALPQRSNADEPALSEANQRLASVRPRSRPSGLIEQNERENLGGLTRNELSRKRPKARPASAQQQAEAQRVQAVADAAAKAAVDNAVAEATKVTPFDSATAQAVAQSRKPKPRPNNFANVVDRARKAQNSAETQEVTRVAAAVPRQQKTAPKIPSKASVAKAATVRNQLNLRKINLIGVYGKPSSRRALVRLANGRYKKVKVGDRIDGGRISSIGDGELRYTKNGRNVILKMPRG